MPDRLPSLIVLAGFWVPPAAAGWVAAGALPKQTTRQPAFAYVTMVAFVTAYAAAWFYYNLPRMPPYIPGAVMDPTIATPQAIVWLAAFAGGVILPGSAIAFAIAFRQRRRTTLR